MQSGRLCSVCKGHGVSSMGGLTIRLVPGQCLSLLLLSTQITSVYLSGTRHMVQLPTNDIAHPSRLT